MIAHSRLQPVATIALVLIAPVTARAGMPMPLPTDVVRYLQLRETPLERLQVVSFFLLVFALCAIAVKLLWNYVQRDFTALPRLTFGKAAAVVLLWGLLFVVVLTMISGARELMTPGAWQKQGATYKLASPPADGPPASAAITSPRDEAPP